MSGSTTTNCTLNFYNNSHVVELSWSSRRERGTFEFNNRKCRPADDPSLGRVVALVSTSPRTVPKDIPTAVVLKQWPLGSAVLLSTLVFRFQNKRNYA